MCEDKKCIQLNKVCDGKRDCIGGRDEQGCTYTLRSSYYSSIDESRTPTPSSVHQVSQYDVASESAQVKIAIYDSTQTVNEGNDVVFRCRDESTLRVPVHWSRSGTSNDHQLPSNANDYNGRLTITKVTQENEGVYYCHAHGYPERKTAQLIIPGGRCKL